jgi:hypothetical protein
MRKRPNGVSRIYSSRSPICRSGGTDGDQPQPAFRGGLSGRRRHRTRIHHRQNEEEGGSSLLPLVPTVFVSEESLTRVNFPLYTSKCLHNHTTDEFGPINCDFPTELLQIIAWRQLETYAPSAVELISRLSITEDIMDEFIKAYIKLLPKFTTERYQELTHTVVCERFKEHPEVWPLWIPVPVESVRLEFSTWEVALIITVAILVIVLAFIFLFFIFWFRKRTIVRYSEPVFLSTMMVGYILVAVGMILNVVPNPLETYEFFFLYHLEGDEHG